MGIDALIRSSQFDVGLELDFSAGIDSSTSMLSSSIFILSKNVSTTFTKEKGFFLPVQFKAQADI
jgi:hypothetical protein